MTTQENNEDRIALLQGTLDLLILKTLVLGSCHGQGVARSIQRQSEEVFLVDHGSLYLALQRLEDKKWISAKWGLSENNRKARFYSLTAKGREQLVYCPRISWTFVYGFWGQCIQAGSVQEFGGIGRVWRGWSQLWQSRRRALDSRSRRSGNLQWR